NGVCHAERGSSVNQMLPTFGAMALGQYGEYEGPSTGQVVVYLAIAVLVVASFWKIFAKAGKPGWAAIIPIYNLVVYLQVVNRPIWWIILLFIPLVNIVIFIVLTNDLAKAFGKGVGWTIGLIFLGFIFYPILGFGADRYIGRQAPAQPQAA
ncbi:MAG TPA: DUF5684 domain-containing protein, partial [Anaeromyxobacteraceae bacterium]|nr:DUF5684 domain-containing protein [Anaeromyxobacteraceae bacterium]